MRYHIVTNEVVSYYTEIEAEDEEQARESALKKGGVWLRLPHSISHEVVSVMDKDTPHQGTEK